MTKLYIAHNKINPHVCITHYDSNLLQKILLILAANYHGVANKDSLTANQKNKFIDKFEFIEIDLEDN